MTRIPEKVLPRKLFIGETNESYFIEVVPPMTDVELACVRPPMEAQIGGWPYGQLAMHSRGRQIFGYDKSGISFEFQSFLAVFAKNIGGIVVNSDPESYIDVDIRQVLPVLAEAI
jgi:hypothetical protein